MWSQPTVSRRALHLRPGEAEVGGTETREPERPEGNRRLSLGRTSFAKSVQEFERLKDGEIIYKLVGPVLVKQETVEAEGTVKGRLEFIGKEL